MTRIGITGGGLGLGRGMGPRLTVGGATPWYLAGGIAAANAVAVYQAIGAASLAASYVNLANPGTYDATAPVAAPTFAAATGWTFDGATQYLATGIVPTIIGQPWSMFVRFSNCSGNTRCLAGIRAGPTREFHLFYESGGICRYANGNILDIAPALAAGVLGFAGNVAYRNGVAEAGTMAAAGGDANALGIYIGARNETSTARYTIGNIQAVAIYSAVLTAPQAVAVSVALANLT